MSFAAWGGAVDDIGKAGKTILDSNKSITNVYDFFSGGFRNVAKNMGEGTDFMPAVKQAYSKGNVAGGGVNVSAIAGSYLTASAGYRALSGGGAYRDKNGNTNIAAVPFV
jgi:hypothetical protein